MRWLPLGVAAAAVVAVGYLGYLRWWPEDTTTEVTVDEVLDRYRDAIGTAPVLPVVPVTSVTERGTAAPTAPPATATITAAATAVAPPDTVAPTTTPIPVALPAPGVYRYATDGREHVTALGGTDHVYPAETSLTVTPHGCGVHLRWDLLAERYEEWNLCVTDGAVTLQPTGVQFHQFFGQAQTDVSECLATVPLNPPPPIGTAIPRDCRLADEPWNPVWTSAGTGTATVDGGAVATTSFDVTIELTGEYPEHSTQHWVFAPDGLPVSISVDMESANPSPVGSVTYTETIVATLVSRNPLS